jgi:hypothetical protein
MIRLALCFTALGAAPAFAHSEPFFHLHEIPAWQIAGAVVATLAVSFSIKVFRK